VSSNFILKSVVITILFSIILCCFSLQGIAGNKESDNTKSYRRVVSSNRLWRCPKCQMVLQKSLLGKVWKAGDSISHVSGTGTCAKCGSRYPQADIYGGKYDIHLKAKIAGKNENPKTVSIVVFQESGISSIEEAHRICSKIKNRYYPAAALEKYYVIQHRDKLTLDEAFINYTCHVEDGALPFLGEQFNARKLKNQNDEDVVVLFFKLPKMNG